MGQTKRGSVNVVVFRGEKYDDNFPDTGSLFAFADWLQAVIASIPEEYRSVAEIEIDSTSGYKGSHYATIEISYRRPETDEEWAAREAAIERRAAEVEASERRQLAALMVKYDLPV